MFKKILTVLAIVLLPLVFTACSEATPSGKAADTELTETQYACPMDCENGKTYPEAGQCPVCEMDLVEIED